jgi:hypothetical protein
MPGKYVGASASFLFLLVASHIAFNLDDAKAKTICPFGKLPTLSQIQDLATARLSGASYAVPG